MGTRGTLGKHHEVHRKQREEAEKWLKVTDHAVHAMENRVTGAAQSKRHRWA